MRAKLFEVGRQAAKKLRELSADEDGPLERRGLHHSVDGTRSVRAELDAIRTNYKNQGIASTRIAASLSIDEARRIIRENSISKQTRNNSHRHR